MGISAVRHYHALMFSWRLLCEAVPVSYEALCLTLFGLLFRARIRAECILLAALEYPLTGIYSASIRSLDSFFRLVESLLLTRLVLLLQVSFPPPALVTLSPRYLLTSGTDTIAGTLKKTELQGS